MKNFIASCTLALCAAVVLALGRAYGEATTPSPAGPAQPGAYDLSEFEITDAEGIRPYSAAVESTFQPYGELTGAVTMRQGIVRAEHEHTSLTFICRFQQHPPVP